MDNSIAISLVKSEVENRDRQDTYYQYQQSKSSGVQNPRSDISNQRDEVHFQNVITFLTSNVIPEGHTFATISRESSSYRVRLLSLVCIFYSINYEHPLCFIAYWWSLVSRSEATKKSHNWPQRTVWYNFSFACGPTIETQTSGDTSERNWPRFLLENHLTRCQKICFTVHPLFTNQGWNIKVQKYPYSIKEVMELFEINGTWTISKC